MASLCERRPALEAQPAYESAHLVAQDLVQRVKELLGQVGQGAAAGWSDVGEIVDVANRLAGAVSLLESMARKE